ncbi:MAG: hypothetical protein AAGG02_01825 [Cyanobacteria bacterium P01_H01_bin.15]
MPALTLHSTWEIYGDEPSAFAKAHQSELLPSWQSQPLRSQLIILQPVNLDGEREIVNERKNEARHEFLAWSERFRAFFLQQINSGSSEIPLDNLVEVFDPASGYPVYSAAGNLTWADVPNAAESLGFSRFDWEGCRALCHPRWGRHVYPGTLVSKMTLTRSWAILQSFISIEESPNHSFCS